MQCWLKCEVSAGQFSSEYGVVGKQADGSVFSLFVPKSHVQVEREPVGDEGVSGWLRVDIWETHNGTAIIVLPRQSFEAGRYVTVHASQLTVPTTEQAVS